MKLTDVIRRGSPSVVAFGSRMGRSADSTVPGFPPLIGTGFFVDRRGLVATNDHVVQALRQVPAPARFVMIFPEPDSIEGRTQFGVILRSIKSVNSVSSFESSAPFFGQAMPDFAFVHIDVQDVPPLEICGDSNTIEVGLDIATLGFPMGEVPLMPYDPSKASQISAFARKGIVSSVLPCACADPHGFSIDVLSEGGASGSPIFRIDDPAVIGILHAGYKGAPITYGVPGHLLKMAFELVTQNWNPDLGGIPTLSELCAERVLGTKEFSWSTILVPREE